MFVCRGVSSNSRIFCSYGDVTITSEGLLLTYTAFMTIEQWRFFKVPRLPFIMVISEVKNLNIFNFSVFDDTSDEILVYLHAFNTMKTQVKLFEVFFVISCKITQEWWNKSRITNFFVCSFDNYPLETKYKSLLPMKCCKIKAYARGLLPFSNEGMFTYYATLAVTRGLGSCNPIRRIAPI